VSSESSSEASEDITEELGDTDGTSSTESEDEDYIDVVRCKWEYLPCQDDELHLLQDDVVYVFYRNRDGWLEGKVGTTWGLFPASYTVSITD